MTKTTYILAGGYDRNYADFPGRLYDEIRKYTSDIKFLSCFFSQPEESWNERAEDWKGWFAKKFPVPIDYTYAEENNFLNQIDAANVIFFHGGNTKSLLDRLPDKEVLRENFKGKIVIGSSAGANMLSHYFWSSGRGVYGEGLGLLDINVMVHYGAKDISDRVRTLKDWQRDENEFAAMINRPITHLPEGQFIVVQK